MFGKGKAKQTGTQKFIMGMGKKAGNFGGSSGSKKAAKGTSPNPFEPRTLKVGQNKRFDC